MTLTIEKLLEAKKLFDEDKAQQVGLWWNSVNPFQVWGPDTFQNVPWSELPEWAKHELVGIHDSLPMPVCQH